jgi:signal transduction histidine kinase
MILLAAIAVGGVAFGVASVVLARRIAGPIVDIEDATGRIAEGDYSVQVSAPSRDEVGRLADSINDLASRLEELEGARMRFISEVSHDLRTPLAAVKGLLANLVDDANPLDRPELELAERQTDRLIRLVNQLLDFARWQGGRLVIERRPVDVGAIARDAVALCAAAASHRTVGLSTEVPEHPVVLHGDGDRLQRVLLNLIDNAIKFTPLGGSVVVRVAVLESHAAITVSDTGRGMSHEELNEAFEPYRRGEGGGTGLGLAISRAIVDAHGGKMDLDSAPGRGCRIRFTLPL